jgi:hypothetical protein
MASSAPAKRLKKSFKVINKIEDIYTGGKIVTSKDEGTRLSNANVHSCPFRVSILLLPRRS